jgi:hypothetical protein
MMPQTRLLWQPEVIPGQGVSILLSGEFATQCQKRTISPDKRQLVLNNVWQFAQLGNRGDGVPSDFLRFDGDSLLLACVYRPMSNGVWLSVDTPEIKIAEGENLAYYGHNDEHLADQWWLLRGQSFLLNIIYH